MINISIYQFSFSIALNFNLQPYLLCKCRIVVVSKTDFIVLIIKVMIVMYNFKKEFLPGSQKNNSNVMDVGGGSKDES